MVFLKMKDKFQKLKNAIECNPKYLIAQKVIFPIYSFDLTGVIDPESIVKRALPFKKNNSESAKPEIVKNGYQTVYIQEVDSNLFSDLNNVIEDKCKLIFKQNYKARDYWFVFYEHGSEVLNHNHYNLNSFNRGENKFQNYPLSVAYYPLCSEKSSPIIFSSHTEGNPDLIIPVKQNTLLLFNANLYHYVPSSNEDNLRLVYSCNLYLED
jgi:hypothetical protein